jgi:hypothetical protein
MPFRIKRGALEAAEKLLFCIRARLETFVLYQGTTSVVPKLPCLQWASAPGFLFTARQPTFSTASLAHEKAAPAGAYRSAP